MPPAVQVNTPAAKISALIYPATKVNPRSPIPAHNNPPKLLETPLPPIGFATFVLWWILGFLLGPIAKRGLRRFGSGHPSAS
jgi:hypothetical protein